MNKYILISLLLNVFVFAQAQQDIRQLNIEGLNYNSCMKIVEDPTVPFARKMEIARQITNMQQRDEVTNIFNALITQGKNQNDATSLMWLYSSLGSLYRIHFDLKTAKSYLDMASTYEKKVKDNAVLAKYYGATGSYYGSIFDEKNAHYNYYKAISFYEKAGQSEGYIINMLYNISIFFINRNDAENLKKIINQMVLLAPKIKDKSDAIFFYRAKSAYYQILFQRGSKKNKPDYSLLDSVVRYEKKSIDIFDSSDPITKSKYQRHMALSYSNLADIESSKPNPDWQQVIQYIDNSKNLADSTDIQTRGFNSMIKARAFYHKGSTDSALAESLDAFRIFNKVDKTRFLAERSECCELMSLIYEKKKMYVEALFYQRKKNEYDMQLYINEQDKAVKEIQTKYETQEKENKIIQLTERTHYQEKIKYLYYGIIALSVFISFFIIRSLRLKRKSDLHQLENVKIKKEEAELQLQLKEEQAARSELEKYEALLEIRFKEIEIDDKDSELKKLKEEKEELDILVNQYSDNLKKYEAAISKKRENVEVKSYTYIYDEIKFLITKRLPREKTSFYLDKLEVIDDSFVANIERISNSSISSIFIQYCICFVINMDIKDISECFSVEPSTIHMARYRMKKKLNLNSNEDLYTFLNELR